MSTSNSRSGIAFRIAALRAGDAQRAHRLVAAEQVAHAVADQRPVHRLGDEVGGTVPVCRLDRGDIVHARHHHDRQQRPRFGTQRGADLVPAHVGHVDVEHHQVARLGAELAQRVVAALGQADVEAGLAQGRAHHQGASGSSSTTRIVCRRSLTGVPSFRTAG
ncbi:MAG: hypothetical protein U1F67_13150 [Rubrivivax sp.]